MNPRYQPYPMHYVWIVALAGLTGCAFHNAVDRAPGAPSLPPSANAVTVTTPPVGAVRLGTVTVQANNHQSGADCEAQALFEAKKLGATHVIVRPAESGWGKGPKCIGEAYYRAPTQ
jgi:Zn-dependent alcohol dehydrogenase